MSVPPVRTKLAGFVLAGAIAGVAGGLYAVLLGAVGFNTYDPSYGLVVFSMAVIGGLGSISGVLMGVALIEILSYWYPKYQLVFTGVGLLLILLFLPGGLAEGVQCIRDRLLKVVAMRRQILVPSLVADKRVELTDHAPEESALLEHALSEEEGDGAWRPPCRSASSCRWRTPATRRRTQVPAVAAPRPPVTASGRRCRQRVRRPHPGHAGRPLVQKVEVSYGPVQILFGVDLEVHEGEIVALLGTNGAGKSTLLKGASGLVKVGGGAVRLTAQADHRRPGGGDRPPGPVPHARRAWHLPHADGRREPPPGHLDDPQGPPRRGRGQGSG